MSKITTSKIKNSNQSETVENVVSGKIDSIINWLDKNTKAIAVGFAAVLAGCAVFFVWSLFAQKTALKKFEASFAIEKDIIAFDEKVEKSKIEKEPTAYETKDQDLDKIHGQVAEFIKANPGHGSSRNLALKWSKSLYTDEKFEKALEVINSLKIEKTNSLEGLGLLSKASLSLQLGQTKEAVGFFKDIISTKKWSYLHPEARFQLSLALIKDQNTVEAIENLKTLKTEHPDERKTVEDATKLLRWLQYQKNTNQSDAIQNDKKG